MIHLTKYLTLATVVLKVCSKQYR